MAADDTRPGLLDELLTRALVERGFSGPWEDNPVRDFMATYFDHDDDVTRGMVIDFLERIAALAGRSVTPDGRFRPDYDWTSTCPHEGDEVCPDGDDGCRCECHAVRSPEEPPR